MKNIIVYLVAGREYSSYNAAFAAQIRSGQQMEVVVRRVAEAA
jgi:hypothetical protein